METTKTEGPNSPTHVKKDAIEAEVESPNDVADVCALLALEPEVEEGCHEYKRHLVNPTPVRFEELVTQLKWRLSEGQGEAIYEIGVEDDGTLLGLSDADMKASYETLKFMADKLDASVSISAERAGKHGITRTALVRQRLTQATHLEIRVVTVGNVDSGKSTLLGVLTKGVLDNGRGLARGNVFRHKHEAESGRTSAISQQILGFAADGSVANYASPNVRECGHSLRWSEIVSGSAKVVSFLDLCGHEKYLRTTLFGLTGHMPDYAMMVVDSNRGGIVGMTKEHLGIVLALKVPMIVTITKVDMCSEHLLKKTLDAVTKLLKRQGVNKMPLIMKSEADVLTAAKAITGNHITPVFLTSCVNGQSLDLIRLFLNLLPARRSWDKSEASDARVHLDDAFQVVGIGTVVSGVVVSGSVAHNQPLLLGPDGNGAFKEVVVKSVMNKRVGVPRAEAGQTASFAIKGKKEIVRKRDIRKGMVLVDPSSHPQATWQFEAEVLILVHPTTLKPGYTPVIHCLTVRQAARIMHMTKDYLRSGDRATVTFQWMYRPEYICEGTRIIFREGRTKGIGMVTKVMPSEPRKENIKAHMLRGNSATHEEGEGGAAAATATATAAVATCSAAAAAAATSEDAATSSEAAARREVTQVA